MSDYLSQHQVTRDYYKEAKQAAVVPMDCPYCKRRGKFAANGYEMARRIPSIMTEGIAFCHLCRGVAVTSTDVTSLKRAWYCGYCEIVICPTCQIKSKATASKAA